MKNNLVFYTRHAPCGEWTNCVMNGCSLEDNELRNSGIVQVTIIIKLDGHLSA